jgi:hypothetical protein
MNLEGLTEKRNRKGTVYYENQLKEIVLKRCNGCMETKEINLYHNDKSGIGGKRSKCKSCDADRDRNYHGKNREKVLERMRKSYEENREERIGYYYKHRDKSLILKRNRYEENRDRELARMRNWQRKNPEKVALYVKKRRARKAALPSTLTVAQYALTLEYFGNACALTGRTDNIEQEHAIPQSIGGGFTFENIYPMTKTLNISKFNHNIFEWFEANRQRFNLDQERFDRLIEWLGKANGMSVEKYRVYVYECHANPNVIDDAKAI